MISYPMLGRYGRLGNQLFQFASTYAASRKSNTVCRFPKSNHSLHDFSIPLEYFTDEIKFDYIFNDDEQDFSFNPVIHQLPVGTAITGYLQNPNNFIEYRDEIIKMLDLKSHIKDAAKEVMKNRKNTISIHVRRGDYLNIQDVLPCQSVEYYMNAVSFFNNATPVIFTDDPEWCKANFPYEVIHNDVITDFACMLLCDGHVMSNSSFSWWVSFLTQKNTVAPIKWFGDKGVKNWQDLYDPKWIKF